MKLIIIPCCKVKEEGGRPIYQRSEALWRLLNPLAYDHLMEMRKKLAEQFNLQPGPDLGFNNFSINIEYMPAYRRYVGRIYQRGRVRQLYPVKRFSRLSIISALYGLLDADDLIRNYDLAMDCTLPTGTRLYTWWKQQGLCDILCEYVQALNPTEIHDLLSGNYRKAVVPWPACIAQTWVKQYDFPRQGLNANIQRGEILEMLLH